MWFLFLFVHQITVPGTLPTTAGAEAWPSASSPTSGQDASAAAVTWKTNRERERYVGQHFTLDISKVDLMMNPEWKVDRADIIFMGREEWLCRLFCCRGQDQEADKESDGKMQSQLPGEFVYSNSGAKWKHCLFEMAERVQKTMWCSWTPDYKTSTEENRHHKETCVLFLENNKQDVINDHDSVLSVCFLNNRVPDQDCSICVPVVDGLSSLCGSTRL